VYSCILEHEIRIHLAFSHLPSVYAEKNVFNVNTIIFMFSLSLFCSRCYIFAKDEIFVTAFSDLLIKV